MADGVQQSNHEAVVVPPSTTNNDTDGGPFSQDPDHIPFHGNSEEFGGLIPCMLRWIQVALGLVVWIIMAASTYWILYHAMMPREVAVRKVFFQYHARRMPLTTRNPGFRGDQVALLRQQQEYLQQEFIFETAMDDGDHEWGSATNRPPPPPTVSHPLFHQDPFATLDLFAARHDSAWTAHHPSVQPPPQATHRILQSGQRYYFQLTLELPESLRNQQAGMFGIVVQLFSSSPATSSSTMYNSSREDRDSKSTTPKPSLLLASSECWTRLPYESTWIGVIRKLVLLPALLMGAIHESRTVSVWPFRHYVESLQHPLVRALVYTITGDCVVVIWSVYCYAHRVVIVFLLQQFVSIGLVMGRLDIKKDDKCRYMEPIEVDEATIRIGQEMNSLQELVVTWYYCCWSVGTLVCMLVQWLLWKATCALVRGMSHAAFARQEPPCDLDLDNVNLEDDDYFVEEYSYYHDAHSTASDAAPPSSSSSHRYAPPNSTPNENTTNEWEPVRGETRPSTRNDADPDRRVPPNDELWCNSDSPSSWEDL